MGLFETTVEIIVKVSRYTIWTYSHGENVILVKFSLALAIGTVSESENLPNSARFCLFDQKCFDACMVQVARRRFRIVEIAAERWFR